MGSVGTCANALMTSAFSGSDRRSWDLWLGGAASFASRGAADIRDL